ncbi:hypothetical protein [Geodermatophilus sp. SYSU D00698]
MARRTDFAFAEDAFDRLQYPDEILPVYGSDRFPFTVPKTRIDDATLSKVAQLFRERVAEARNGDPADVPEGLLRAVEAADAWPEENVRSLASGRVRSISTEVGEILYVDFWANPLALTHDPNNGRTTTEARAQQLPYLEAVGDDEATGAPVIEVADAAEFIHGVDASARALGFTGSITDSKDLQDINWVGLQGVHEPALTTPTRIQDGHGHGTWVLKQDDGNRRLAMLRRALRVCTTLGMSDTEAWADHLYSPDGGTALREWTAADVANVRRKSQFGDKYWRPQTASREAIEEWLASATMAQRTVIRTSVMPVRLVVGYRPRLDTPTERSTSMEVVHRYIRRTHIKTAAQLDWSPATQAMQVALDTMRRILTRSGRAHGYTMALSRDELQAVYANTVPEWYAADPEDADHPLRLAAKTIATFVCTDTTAEQDVKKSLIAHSMSTHGTKIRENRAAVAASVAMPLLGISVSDDKAGYNRARAAVDRASRHPMFTVVAKHPSGATDPWWKQLNRPVKELLAQAEKEYADGLGIDDTPDDKSYGTFGPATRALLFLSIVGQATNPAVLATVPGEQASPWQLTINGLGGTRGNTLTTPDLVMRQVLSRHKQAGAEQLAEIVQAALAGRLPKNTIDPDYADSDDHARPVERTRGTVTERFLRGERMGWQPAGGGGDDTPPPSPKQDPFELAMDHLRDAVARAANSTVPFLDTTEDVGKHFAEAGLPEEYARTLLKQAKKIVAMLQHGQFLAAARRGGGSSFDFDDDEDEA